VRLPIYDDNKAIASGLTHEAGPLQVYNWIDYINPDVIKDFERKYGVAVKVTTFTSLDEAVTKLISRAVHFDVAVPSIAELNRLVAGKLVQPLNLDYIPNLKANVWPYLADPWYDRGSQYTVPYGLLSVGMSWRADKLPNFDPSKLANPWDAFWQAGNIRGKVGLLDDQRDMLGMAILHGGGADINTGDARQIAAARDDTLDLIGRVAPKFGVNDYEKLPSGALWLHQSWSGNMVLAQHYMPKGTSVDVLRYWWPGGRRGVVGIDQLAVLNGGKNPVLAHLFLNHLLDSDAAIKNFSFMGFQQPVRGSEPDALVKAGLVPPNLRSTLLVESQMRAAQSKGALSQSASVLWQDAWSKIQAA
jgi:spermidine/putrescine transport system substrate-binding protein